MKNTQCNFDGCDNDAVELIEFTEIKEKNKRFYRIPICEKCLHRCQTETPVAKRIEYDPKKPIQKIYFREVRPILTPEDMEDIDL